MKKVIQINITVDKLEEKQLNDIIEFAKELNSKKESRPPRTSFLFETLNKQRQRD